MTTGLDACIWLHFIWMTEVSCSFLHSHSIASGARNVSTANGICNVIFHSQWINWNYSDYSERNGCFIENPIQIHVWYSVSNHSLCVKCWKTIECDSNSKLKMQRMISFHCKIDNLAKVSVFSYYSNEENNELQHANTTFFFVLHFKFVFVFSNFCLSVNPNILCYLLCSVCLSFVFPTAYCLDIKPGLFNVAILLSDLLFLFCYLHQIRWETRKWIAFEWENGKTRRND